MKLRAILITTCLLAGCSVAPRTTQSEPGLTDQTDATTAATAPMPPKAPVTTRLVCKTKKEERVLEMKTSDDGCELTYTRGGNTRSIATSRIGDAACTAVRGKTQTNLERSGYRCEAN